MDIDVTKKKGHNTPGGGGGDVSDEGRECTNSDNCIQVNLDSLMDALLQCYQVISPTHSDLTKTFENSRASPSLLLDTDDTLATTNTTTSAVTANGDSGQEHTKKKKWVGQSSSSSSNSTSGDCFNDSTTIESGDNSCDDVVIDAATIELLKRDLEEVSSDSSKVTHVYEQLRCYVNGRANTPMSKKIVAPTAAAVAAATSTETPGMKTFDSETKRIARGCYIENPITILDLFSSVCCDSNTAVENLASLMMVGDNHFWKLFPAAVEMTLDASIRLLTVWLLIGSLIDIESFGSPISREIIKKGGIVNKNHPRVIATMAAINSLLAKRLSIKTSPSPAPPPSSSTLNTSFQPREQIEEVTLTDTLRNIILPIIKELERSLIG